MIDVPGIAFGCVLVLAAVLAMILGQRARPGARDYLVFAAALYCALALADLAAAVAPRYAPVALSVTLVMGALAPCALTLALADAFAGPLKAWVSFPALLLAASAGIYAAATGAMFVAFAVLFACLCAMLALAARRFTRSRSDALHAVLAALCLLAASSSVMTGGLSAFALFSAAGLMGAALASGGGVVQPRQRAAEARPVGRAIGRLRLRGHGPLGIGQVLPQHLGDERRAQNRCVPKRGARLCLVTGHPLRARACVTVVRVVRRVSPLVAQIAAVAGFFDARGDRTGGVSASRSYNRKSARACHNRSLRQSARRASPAPCEPHKFQDF